MLDRLPPGSRIAVIRVRSLGDCVLTTPALSLLKAHRPDLRIAMVVEERYASVFEGNPDVESVTLPPEVSAVRAMASGGALSNLHGGTRSIAITATSRARSRAGFAHHRFASIYTHKIPRAQDIMHVERKVHTAEHVASAMFFLGVPQSEVPRARLFAAAPVALAPGYAVIHPFASAPEKTWPMDGFLAMAQYIEQNRGLAPVFIPGPGEPANMFGRHKVIPNASIPELKGLMSGAQLFVGNDSGPAHIAAAYGVPCVILFGPTDPAVWAPWRTEGRALKMPGVAAEITVAQVIDAVEAVEASGCMKELARLLRYSKPYTPHLLISVVLMACVGASQALIVLLIRPVFDRVLNPSSAEAPVALFTIPGWGHTIYLDSVMPMSIHNVWTMVAIGILVVFLTKGICDYTANYLINYVGFSAVTDLRQEVFDHVLHQDAQFFESNSTARVMSSIMNDLDKIQVALSHILADWLRQSFSALALLAVVVQTDWRLAVVSLTVLPFVLIPTLRLGKRIRRSTRSAQDNTADLNQVLQETLSGHQVVKSFSAEEIESNRFRDRAHRLLRSNLRYVRQQAIASPLIEFFGAVTIVGLLSYTRLQIKAGAMSAGELTSFVIALLMLYEPVKRLTGIHNIFQQALGSTEKVFKHLGSGPAGRGPSGRGSARAA